MWANAACCCREKAQKQRVSIARIFLKNPPVLILDEATSALDTVTEAGIQGAFDRLSEGRTSILIAHRLSTIKNADRIILIDDGEIKESGTHDQLMAAGGIYHELYETSVVWKGRVGYSRYGRDAGNMKKPAVVAGFFVDMRPASVLQPEKPVGQTVSSAAASLCVYEYAVDCRIGVHVDEGVSVGVCGDAIYLQSVLFQIFADTVSIDRIEIICLVYHVDEISVVRKIFKHADEVVPEVFLCFLRLEVVSQGADAVEQKCRILLVDFAFLEDRSAGIDCEAVAHPVIRQADSPSQELNVS